MFPNGSLLSIIYEASLISVDKILKITAAV